MKKPFEYPTSLKDQICQCQKHYVAKWLLIVDQWRDTSSGMCPECFSEWKRQSLLTDAEQERQAEAERVKQLCETKRELYRREYSGIPLYYQAKNFANIKTNVKGNIKKVLLDCVDYADKYPLDEKPYGSLMLSSPDKYGVGKTHLVCAILHRVLDRWQGKPNYCPVLFTTEPDIYLRIQNTYSFTDSERKVRQSETDIINELINVPLLVIDDVGKQKRSDMKFVQRTLFAIVNGRYDKMKPMVMTTNMNESQLLVYLGANDGSEFDRASFDRLVEMCKGHMWEIDGESQRGKL